MMAYNFYYDGVSLNSKGYILCSFDNGDINGQGSTLTFSTIPIHKGGQWLMADAKYDTCITTKLYICKDLCNVANQENLVFSPQQISDLMRWLNRKSFHALTFDTELWNTITFYATFNVQTVEIGGEVLGLELEMITDSPFAYKPLETVTLEYTAANQTKSFLNKSDEIGFLYPNSMTITCGESGDLRLTNIIENRTSIFKNCVQGEVITINYPVLSTSVSDHKIQNDFNWLFPRTVNTYAIRSDGFHSNKICTVVFSYSPLIKVLV